MSDSTVVDEFGILLDVGPFNLVKITCLLGKSPISFYSSEIPSSFRSLARKFMSYDALPQELYDYLKVSSSDFPIYIMWEGEYLRLNCQVGQQIERKIQFKVQDNLVTINRIGMIEHSTKCQLIPIGDLFVVDLESKSLHVFSDVDGWLVWNSFNSYLAKIEIEPVTPRKKISGIKARNVLTCLEDQSLELSWDDFNYCIKNVEGLDDDQINDSLVKDDPTSQKEVSIDVKSMKFRLNLQRSTVDHSIYLQPECFIDSYAFDSDQTLFSYFFDYRQLPVMIQSKVNKDVICFHMNSLVMAYGTRKFDTVKSHVLTLLEDYYYGQTDVFESVKCYLENFVAYFSSDRSYNAIVDGKWIDISYNRLDEARFFSIVSTLIPSSQSIIEDQTVLKISYSFFRPYWELLQSKLIGLNVDILYNKKRIEFIDCDIAINAKTSGNEWFEIQPEIKINNGVIKEDSWFSLSQSGGVIESDDAVQVLSDKSFVGFQSLLGIMPKYKKKEQKRKYVYEIERLKILDWMYLKRLGIRVSMNEKDQELFNSLLNFKSIQSLPLPNLNKVSLRSYQKDGYYWLGFLYKHKLGACLADDMGLGKTVQTIIFLAALKENIIPRHNKDTFFNMIVVPPSLVFNWQNEINRFYPDFKVVAYHTGLNKSEILENDILLVTYDLLRRNSEFFSEFDFNVIVFDEAQIVKNIYSGRTEAARQLTCQFKVCLTGTPLENHLGEYYSIIDLVLPGLLGGYKQFQRSVKLNDFEYLIRRTRAFVLRRTKDEILSELPAKTESNIFLTLSDSQKEFYLKIVQETKKTVDDAFDRYNQSRARMIALTALLRLRQICLCPSLMDSKIEHVSPKITYLIDRLKQLKMEGHSSLVFSQFRSFLNIVEHYFKKEKLSYYRMDGQTPRKKREHIIQSFQNEVDPSVFLISLKTGGFGLNLTKASYVFLLDPWWNPSVENQASDRVHRIGQDQKVFVVRLIMHHTVEEKMMSLKKKKLDLFKYILDKGVTQSGLNNLSRDDIDFLLGD